MRSWLFLAVMALSALAACGPENGLSGSLSEVFPLEISRVEVYRNDEALQVTYYRNRGQFLDVVVRMSVALKDVELKSGAKIKLDGDYVEGHPRATFAHAPGGEPVRSMPPVKKGDLTIFGGGSPGQVTRGDFSVLFDSKGGDVGFGRTLTGGFSAQTVDAGFGDLP